MTARLKSETGSVTAEFAMVLPAVVLVLAAALGGMQLATVQLRLQDAAGISARMLGRGDAGSQDVIRQLVPGARLSVVHRGTLVCADASLSASLGVVAAITLRASACSLDDAA
jgi:TadE-like protein